MIHQGAPGAEPFWSMPAGRVEDCELVTEGLVREVLEETGLEILDPGRLAFVFHIDNRRAEALHESWASGWVLRDGLDFRRRRLERNGRTRRSRRRRQRGGYMLERRTGRLGDFR
jgi:ADP-ribose pyrophosphatase YjhB (NUDIX family)